MRMMRSLSWSILRLSSPQGNSWPEGCSRFPALRLCQAAHGGQVRAQDGMATPLEVEEGLTARCFCHEIDHLGGHLFDELVDWTYTIEELEAMEAEGKEVEE